MMTHKLISADSHIVEPPDLYTKRIEPRFRDPSQIDFLGTWEDVRLGAYDPQAMVKENEMDGVWGSCLQPSQGLFWYRIPDSTMLSAICHVYNDWIAEFCKP